MTARIWFFSITTSIELDQAKNFRFPSYYFLSEQGGRSFDDVWLSNAIKNAICPRLLAYSLIEILLWCIRASSSSLILRQISLIALLYLRALKYSIVRGFFVKLAFWFFPFLTTRIVDIGLHEFTYIASLWYKNVLTVQKELTLPIRGLFGMFHKAARKSLYAGSQRSILYLLLSDFFLLTTCFSGAIL